eukprot:scpid95905/ scgid19535/ 
MASHVSDSCSSSSSEDEADQNVGNFTASASVRQAKEDAERRLQQECQSIPTNASEKRCVLNARRNRKRRKFYVSALEQKLAEMVERTAKLEEVHSSLKLADQELTEQVRHLRREVVRKLYSGLSGSQDAPKDLLNRLESAATSTSACQENQPSQACGNMSSTLRCIKCARRVSIVFPDHVCHDHSYSSGAGVDISRSTNVSTDIRLENDST